MFWPCPSDDHPGTPRLFADRFHHPDGRAKFFPVEHRPGGDTPDDRFPFLFTTGYDASAIPGEFADVPRVEKPTNERAIVAALNGMR